MIFMAFNFVLENYFEDVLSLVDQSSNICDEILGCWFLLFNIYIYIYILWIIQIKYIFFAYDFGVLQLDFHVKHKIKQPLNTKLKQHIYRITYQTHISAWGPPVQVFKQQTTLLKMGYQTALKHLTSKATRIYLSMPF